MAAPSSSHCLALPIPVPLLGPKSLHLSKLASPHSQMGTDSKLREMREQQKNLAEKITSLELKEGRKSWEENIALSV